MRPWCGANSDLCMLLTVFLKTERKDRIWDKTGTRIGFGSLLSG